jgi:hypothetical protein
MSLAPELRGVYIHRSKHTFTVNYLRNGGYLWNLQMMLEYAALEMVKKTQGLANVGAPGFFELIESWEWPEQVSSMLRKFV